MNDKEPNKLMAVAMETSRVFQQIRKQDRVHLIPVVKRLQKQFAEHPEAQIREFGVALTDSVLESWRQSCRDGTGADPSPYPVMPDVRSPAAFGFIVRVDDGYLGNPDFGDVGLTQNIRDAEVFYCEEDARIAHEWVCRDAPCVLIKLPLESRG